MDMSADLPCESPAVAAHRTSAADDDIGNATFASSVYSCDSSALSSSSVVSDISVSPITRRLIQNALMAATGANARESTTNNNHTQRSKRMPPNKLRGGSRKKHKKRSARSLLPQECLQDQSRALSHQRGSHPQERSARKPAAVMTGVLDPLSGDAAVEPGSSHHDHYGGGNTKGNGLCHPDGTAESSTAAASRPEDPVARCLLRGNGTTEQDKQVALAVPEGIDTSSTFAAAAAAAGQEAPSNCDINSKGGKENACSRKTSELEELQAQREGERPTKIRRTNQSSSAATATRAASTTTATTTTRRLLRRRDYGFIIPKDFLPIQYSTPTTATASSHSCVSNGSSFASPTANGGDKTASAASMLATARSFSVPNPLLGIPLTPPRQSPTSAAADVPARSALTKATGKSVRNGINKNNVIDTILSDDVLSRCLYTQGYLNTYETARLVRVCKKWRRLARKTIWRLDLSYSWTTSSNGNNQKVKKLEFSSPSGTMDSSRDGDGEGYGVLDFTQMKRLVSCFSNLTTLDLSYCTEWGKNDELSCLIPLSKTLTSLSLKGTAVCDKHMTQYFKDSWAFLDFVPSLPLESLDLSATSKDPGSMQISDETVMSIVKHCPKLKCLRLAWCRRVTDKSIACMAGSSAQLPVATGDGLHYLEDLDLSLTGLTDDCAMDLARVLANNSKTLRQLDLSATALTSEGMHQVVCQASSHLMKLQDGRTSPSGSSRSRCPSPALSTSVATNSRCESPETIVSYASSAGTCYFDALQHLTMRFIDGLSVSTVQKWLELAMSSPSSKFQFLDVTYSGQDNEPRLVASAEDNPELISLLQQYQQRIISTHESPKRLTIKGLICSAPLASRENKVTVKPSRNEQTIKERNECG